MSASPRPRASRIWGTRSYAPTSTPSGSSVSARARCRSSKTACPALIAEGLASKRLSFVVGAPVAARSAEIVFLCVQTPQGADGAADLSYVEQVAAGDRAGPHPEGDRGQQVDGSGRLDPVRPARAGRGGHTAGAHHRRVQPGVPPRGTSRARLPASRSHRDRLRGPGVGGSCVGAVPGSERAGARHRSRVGRDDQVRIERLPRDQGLVHQRDRQPVRGGRRRCARGRDRHGLRRAHRIPVPAPGPRLRRIVLPEGCRRAPAHRA